MEHFKIVSEDGLASNTKIYYGDKILNGITNINLNLDAEIGYAVANFTVVMPLLDITLPSSCVSIEPFDQGKFPILLQPLVTNS